MKKQFKYGVTLIMVLVIFCLCTQFTFARIAFNWRECANADDTTLKASESNTKVQEMKIDGVKSAAYFLSSNSAFQSFLNRVEMGETNGIDYTELKNILAQSINNMKKAKAAYAKVQKAAIKLPYNQEFMNQLMTFDYDGFKVKHGMVEPMWGKLRHHLINGDLSGFDLAVLSNMDAILGKLYEIRVAVNREEVPEIALLWRTNQTYLEAQLFGQYMSEVFKTILDK